MIATNSLRRLVTVAAFSITVVLGTATAATAAPAPTLTAGQFAAQTGWTDVAYIGVGETVEMTSGLGAYQFQLGQGSRGDRRILQITLRLGPDATYNATWAASVTGAVRINGKNTGWTYSKVMKPADYVFHSTVNEFQYQGDAPWTSHRLHPGDVVEIAYTALIPNVNRSVGQINYRTSLILR